jgi:SAM-dependent MidA family methyltransferase
LYLSLSLSLTISMYLSLCLYLPSSSYYVSHLMSVPT